MASVGKSVAVTSAASIVANVLPCKLPSSKIEALLISTFRVGNWAVYSSASRRTLARELKSAVSRWMGRW